MRKVYLTPRAAFCEVSLPQALCTSPGEITTTQTGSSSGDNGGSPGQLGRAPRRPF